MSQFIKCPHCRSLPNFTKLSLIHWFIHELHFKRICYTAAANGVLTGHFTLSVPATFSFVVLLRISSFALVLVSGFSCLRHETDLGVELISNLVLQTLFSLWFPWRGAVNTWCIVILYFRIRQALSEDWGQPNLLSKFYLRQFFLFQNTTGRNPFLFQPLLFFYHLSEV